MEKASQILMDATFLCYPKKFYQLFNIIAVIGENHFLFPIIHVLMTHKSSYSYEKIFNNINEIIKEMDIKFSFNKAHIMSSFEHPLLKAIKKIYPQCILEGCYFHYSKALWIKSKKLGLVNQKYIKIIIFIIFGYKKHPFLKEDDKNNFLSSIDKFIEKYKNLIKLSKYFHSNLENSNFINFNSIEYKIILYRTNNYK